MKNISYFILLGIAVLQLSCSKFLNTEPTDFTSPEVFFNTETELNQALAGVYNALAQDGTFGRHLVVNLSHGSDEAFYKRNNTNPTPQLYTHDPANVTIQSCWQTLYQGINRANLLLANVDKPQMDEAKRDAIKGEALFIRAFCYFQLVHLWGGVPLLLEPTTSGEGVDIPRASEAEVYAQVLEDMVAAEGLVRRITDIGYPGRISKTAVQGILARVCLKMAGYPFNDASKYEEAKYWANKVIESGEHELNPDYAQIFINHSADLYDIGENIWEIEFWGTNTGTPYQVGGRFSKDLAILNTGSEIYGYAFFGATAILYRQYTDPNDVRRDWNIAPFYYQPASSTNKVERGETGIYNRDIGKWRVEYETVLPRGRNQGPTNFPVLRYADVLLMFAEAENELNGPTEAAFQVLNAVRGRAHAAAFTPTEASDKTSFRRIIQDERSRELCFEALRKFDLIRWGIFYDVMKDVGVDMEIDAPSNLRYGARGYNNVSERHVLLPIPTTELSLNKAMTQNPGW